MDKELKLNIERAATGLLTDQEILDSLNITQEQLDEHYPAVRAIRIKVKQKLNGKRLTEAATPGDLAELVAQIPRNTLSRSNYGGIRAGQGRPKGSTNKLSAKSLLDAIMAKSGAPFEMLFAEGYQEAIDKRDGSLRFQYERLILGKVIADKVEQEPVLTAEQINAELANIVKSKTKK